MVDTLSYRYMVRYLYFACTHASLSCPDQNQTIKGAFFWAYSGIGILGISQKILRSLTTLIPEWL